MSFDHFGAAFGDPEPGELEAAARVRAANIASNAQIQSANIAAAAQEEMAARRNGDISGTGLLTKYRPSGGGDWATPRGEGANQVNAADLAAAAHEYAADQTLAGTKATATAHENAARITATESNPGWNKYYQNLAAGADLANQATKQRTAQKAYDTGAAKILGGSGPDYWEKNPDLKTLYDTHAQTGDLNALAAAHDNHQWFTTNTPNMDGAFDYAASKGYPIAPQAQQTIRAGFAAKDPGVRQQFGGLFDDYAKNGSTAPGNSSPSHAP
jgi:hypothetical protein